MKRLEAYIMGQAPQEDNYILMYEGKMVDVTAVPLPESYYEPVYWFEDTYGFRIERTGKETPSLARVTVYIPLSNIFTHEEELPLKRLRYYLLNLLPNDETYNTIYEGKVLAHTYYGSEKPSEFPEEHEDSVFWEEEADDIQAEERRDPNYWEGEAAAKKGVSYRVTMSNKLQKDMPTVTVRIPCENIAGLPVPETDGMRVQGSFSAPVIACADHCLRAFGAQIDALNAENYNRARPDVENGAYYIARPGGEVLATNGAYFAMVPPKYYENGRGNIIYIRDSAQEGRTPVLCLCMTLQVQLPRRKHEKAVKMLCKDLPHAVAGFVRTFDNEACAAAVALAERQQAIRTWLQDSPYCAFLANGSILPRDKKTGGALQDAVPFTAPEGSAITVCGVEGMGIKRGVTVITGGGYSGKSTVLDAISACIYNHVMGDGRELCITDETAVSIAAEDGRCVKNLNISPFIKWLPCGDTRDFSTDHASGSTSQAANIMEAVDGGTRLLLIDEDRSATNFMIRDRLMKALIAREPITPFTDRVRELAGRGVSTILVIGGSGEYLAAADHVFLMEDYRMFDVSDRAHMLAQQYDIVTAQPDAADWSEHRILRREGFSAYPNGRGAEQLEVSDFGYLLIGAERVDIRGLYNIETTTQLTAIALILRQVMIEEKEETLPLAARVQGCLARLEGEGLDMLYTSVFPKCGRFCSLPRMQEILAVVNRMRKTAYDKID